MGFFSLYVELLQYLVGRKNGREGEERERKRRERRKGKRDKVIEGTIK